MPYSFQMIGWGMVVAAPLYWILGNFVLDGLEWFGDGNRYMNNMILQSLFYIGILLVAFSREKDEDEMVKEIRVGSLAIAGYAALLLFVITTFTGEFWYAHMKGEPDVDGWFKFCRVTQLFFNIFVWLFVYLAIYKIRLWKSRWETHKSMKEGF